VAEAAGANIDHAIEGISFLPLLIGNNQSDKDRPVFFERREGGERYGGLTIQSVRLNDWKLIQNSPFSPQELYNVKEDPYEKRNIIQDNPNKSEVLNELLRKHIQKAGGIPWQKNSPISKF
jgi:arylsulfatase A-like enzyme